MNEPYDYATRSVLDALTTLEKHQVLSTAEVKGLRQKITKAYDAEAGHTAFTALVEQEQAKHPGMTVMQAQEKVWKSAAGQQAYARHRASNPMRV